MTDSQNPQTTRELSSSPCLTGERVTFTGKLASMTHAQAAELVTDHGGIATEHVSRQTTMLVIGEEGWPLEDDGCPSVKLQQVEKLRDEGGGIHILSESSFLTLVGLGEHRDEIHRLYTPAMLSSILHVSVHVIRSWERMGLIKPVKRLYRLPYFDFREVSSARRLSELLQKGVSRRSLEESLRFLPSVRRGEERPLEQLEILILHASVVVRDEHGIMIPGNGQRLLNFDENPAKTGELENESSEGSANEDRETTGLKFQPSVPDSAEPVDWMVEACRLYDSDRVSESLAAFRKAAQQAPHAAEIHFQLAECLYRLEQTSAALERYYVTVEHDPDFLEAWTQIGCLHRELGEVELAKEAFWKSLDLLPEYPDAHYHLAETLHETGDTDSALFHWEEYLKHDTRGLWADIARERMNPGGGGESIAFEGELSEELSEDELSEDELAESEYDTPSN